MPIKVEPALCEDHEEIRTPSKKLVVFQMFAKVFFGSLALLVLFATAFEAYLVNCLSSSSTSGHHHITLRQQSTLSALSYADDPAEVYNNHGTLTQLFLAFSAIGNTARLGAVSEGRYAVVDTFRVVGVFAASTMHSLFAALPLAHQAIRGHAHTAPTEIFHENAYWFARTPGLWVDMLIFTLGFTVLVSQFKKLKSSQGGSFNYISFFLLPYARLVMLMIAVVIAIWWLPDFGRGPMWHVVREDLAGSCINVDRLMPDFLLYGNWVGLLSNYTTAMTCNQPTWLLGTAAQLYLLTPLIFLSLYFCPSFGLGTVFAVFSLTPILILSPLIFENIPTYFELTKLYSLTDFYRSFLHYHYSPSQYLPAVMAGLVTGYMVVKSPTMRITGGRKMGVILWLALSAALMGVFVWHCTFWEVNKVVNSENVFAWLIVSKLVLLSWISFTVYVCATGRSAFLNSIFTIHWLTPVAKLSAAIYLLRTMTMFMRMGSPQHTYELTLWHTAEHCITDYLLTVFLAYLLHLLLEGPVLRAVKVISERQSNQSLFKGSSRTTRKDSTKCKSEENNNVFNCPVTLKLSEASSKE